MYRGFKLANIEKSCFKEQFDYFYNVGVENFNKDKKHVEKQMSQFIIGNGILDGSAIQKNWFPQVSCDIFISHSHIDKDLAIALSGWLRYHFELKSFIDSSIWGYADDLLKIIDDKYCKTILGKNYDYQSRNYSTSHVHIMLNMALMQIIDKTECLFFLNTPNSISLSDIETRTLSPWIYSEIGISQMIQKKKPIRRKTRNFSKGLGIPAMIYNLDLSHLSELNIGIINEWNKTNIEPYPLDHLYQLIPAT